MLLHRGFHATGEVGLREAQIKGGLRCEGGSFIDPTGSALDVQKAVIGQDAVLREGFRAVGQVCLMGAKIAGTLECRGARFKGGRAPGRRALTADRAVVEGSAFLDEGFRATGEVCLSHATIRGQLSFRAGTFANPLAASLTTDWAEIGGSVFTDRGFRARGRVRMVGTKIGGDFECRPSVSFKGPQDAFAGRDLHVQGAFFVSGGPDMEFAGRFDLSHATAGTLADDARWPGVPGQWGIDGFNYEAIGPKSPTDAKRRVAWLRQMYPKGATKRERRGLFRPQPYEQLAKVLRLAGHGRDADQVLIAKEDDERRYGDMRLSRRVVHWFWKWTVGYGYWLWLAVVWLLVFLLAGTAVFGGGAACAPADDPGMVPAKERVYLTPEWKADKTLPAEYPRFEAFAYSLDCFLPLVDLRQEAHWQPGSGSAAAWARWVYLWVHITAGWLLSFAFVAGVTNAVRRPRST